MSRYVTGDIFGAEVQVLVNPVNTVGVMGKGLARQFKQRYPAMFEQYRRMCQQGEFTVGDLWLYEGVVLNFPTKTHWRKPSELAYIEAGLVTFQAEYEALGIESIAFPALGCGHGGLGFDTQVRPLMEAYLSPLSIEVAIYLPRPDGAR
jgi:O-acetyl-ADP-ribose deacetylase (regulator of RNase III)